MPRLAPRPVIILSSLRGSERFADLACEGEEGTVLRVDVSDMAE